MCECCYLTNADINRIYPSFNNKDYDPEQDTVLLAAEYIPILWIVMFKEEDLQTETFRLDNFTYTLTAPVACKQKILQTLAQRQKIIKKYFKTNGNTDQYFKLFNEHINKFEHKYFSIELEAIASLYPKNQFQKLLQNTLKLLDQNNDKAKQNLIKLSEILPEHKFITLEQVDSGIFSDEEQLNFFRILGESLDESAPWE